MKGEHQPFDILLFLFFFQCTWNRKAVRKKKELWKIRHCVFTLSNVECGGDRWGWTTTSTGRGEFLHSTCPFFVPLSLFSSRCFIVLFVSVSLNPTWWIASRKRMTTIPVSLVKTKCFHSFGQGKIKKVSTVLSYSFSWNKMLANFHIRRRAWKQGSIGVGRRGKR